MARLLILFAHPALQKSRVHRHLVDRASEVSGALLHDLYEAYPDFLVDVAREQALLLEHDVIVFQHPLYWYGAPPLLKQWMDLVLEHGWAYGSAGTALRGKWLVPVVSAGGGEDAYRPGGMNRHTVREFLLPLEQTARLCGMRYAPPWVVFGTHRLGPADVEGVSDDYRRLLEWLLDAGLEGLDPDATDPLLRVPAPTGDRP